MMIKLTNEELARIVFEHFEKKGIALSSFRIGMDPATREVWGEAKIKETK